MPVTVSLKIVPPPAAGKRGMRVVLSPSKRLFVGSAIKLVLDRWVYFAFILNWRAPALTDPKTVADFARAISLALGIVKERLAS